MKIGVTGATGFIGRYIVKQLIDQGHTCRCWYREGSDRSGFTGYEDSIEWISGSLGDTTSNQRLCDHSDAIVHSALYRETSSFQGEPPDLTNFLQKNVIGSIQLIETAISENVPRFIYLSTCAVHDKILDDRPLDESHPLWPASHYGAHKAAIEKFVHSFGMGQGYPICALRPTGVYGQNTPIENSKWFEIVKSVVEGKTVECTRGGKEVHAEDVAKAVNILLNSSPAQITGKAFSCYDRYISQYEVAELAKQLSQSSASILGETKSPKNQIETKRIRKLGMIFGGDHLLKETIKDLVSAVKEGQSQS